MLKAKISMNEINKSYRRVYRAGYCDLSNILNGVDPIYYNCGMYGWNCDIYVDPARDIAITTGYRNMRGASIPYEIIKKYDKIARDVMESGCNWETRQKELNKNLQNFYDELLKL